MTHAVINMFGGGYTPGYLDGPLQEYFDKRINGLNLDLCCGFRSYVKGSVGLDASALALQHMEEAGKERNRRYAGVVQFDLNHLKDGAKLPFTDGSFGSSTMISGWDYVGPIERLIEEVDRVVIPGGLFYVVQFPRRKFSGDLMSRKENAPKIKARFKSMGYEALIEAIHSEKSVAEYLDITPSEERMLIEAGYGSLLDVEADHLDVVIAKTK